MRGSALCLSVYQLPAHTHLDTTAIRCTVLLCIGRTEREAHGRRTVACRD